MNFSPHLFGSLRAQKSLPWNRPDRNHPMNTLQSSAFVVLLSAIILVQAGCSGSPDSPEVKLERARILMERDQAAEAVPLLNEVIDATPKDPEARYQRGVAYESLDVLEKALADYTECLTLDTERTDALNNKAVVLAKMKRFEEAAAEFSRLVDLDPQGPLAYRNRGLCHFDLKQFDAALADYAKALELDPEEPASWFQRGGVYLAQQRYAEAEQDYTRAISIAPDLAKAWMNRGVARYKRGEKVLAAEDLQKAQSLDDDIVLPDIDFFAPAEHSLPSSALAVQDEWKDLKGFAEMDLASRGFEKLTLLREFPEFGCAEFSAVHSSQSWTLIVGTQSAGDSSMTLPVGPSKGTAETSAALLVLKKSEGTLKPQVVRFEQPWNPDDASLEPILMRYSETPER
jgi:tetratricopeptide (TPR) repeat protein